MTDIFDYAKRVLEENDPSIAVEETLPPHNEEKQDTEVVVPETVN
jgi:hypothetical protein